MLECLVWFLIYVLVAVFVIWILTLGASALGVPIPQPILMIVGAIVLLILLITLLPCLHLPHGPPLRAP